MRKSILNIGKALNKAEQKEVFGGNPPITVVGSPGVPVGLPDTCEEGEAYLLPPCNGEQQALADQGNSYWKCVCGKASGVDKGAAGYLSKVKGYRY